ncbi:MAG: polyprenyl synthetase family protein [Acidimicrobiales bacterium]
MSGAASTSEAEPLPADLRRIAARVEARVATLFEAETSRWAAVDADVRRPLDAVHALVTAGGKRLRPAFCHWGFVAAGGDADDPRIVDAGAAFELLQAFALIHDDVMDGSAVRRGAPPCTASSRTATRPPPGPASLVGSARVWRSSPGTWPWSTRTCSCPWAAPSSPGCGTSCGSS